MRNLIGIVVCSLLLMSCAGGRATPHVGICLANPDIAQAFKGPHKADYANTVLVGGIGWDGQVNCYWSVLGSDGDVLRSKAWQTCEHENSLNCTLLEYLGHIMVKSAKPRPDQVPSFEIIGDFAKPLVEKYRSGGPGETPTGFHCSSRITNPSGDPIYICR